MEERVSSRQDFICFLESLQADLKRGTPEWTNDKLGEFLEAMTAYASDVQGYYVNTNKHVSADEASWQVFADILRGATMYE